MSTEMFEALTGLAAILAALSPIAWYYAKDHRADITRVGCALLLAAAIGLTGRTAIRHIPDTYDSLIVDELNEANDRLRDIYNK